MLCDTRPACMRKDESILYDDEIRWKILHLSLFTMNALDIADPRSLFMCHIQILIGFALYEPLGSWIQCRSQGVLEDTGLNPVREPRFFRLIHHPA